MPPKANLPKEEQTVKENIAPERLYFSFEEYFKNLIRLGSITSEHKEPLKAHFISLGVWNNQANWAKALKHYLGEI